MKRITNYRCDICGFNYSNKEECQQCEKSHIKPVKVEFTGYRNQKDAKCPYPEMIVISMEDNNMVSYVYNDIVPVKGKDEEVQE